jgi:uncharacterized C2H2 Zn-finger protein
MSAHINFEPCPHCGDIRNTHGMTKHIKKAHAAVAAG